EYLLPLTGAVPSWTPRAPLVLRCQKRPLLAEHGSTHQSGSPAIASATVALKQGFGQIGGNNPAPHSSGMGPGGPRAGIHHAAHRACITSFASLGPQGGGPRWGPSWLPRGSGGGGTSPFGKDGHVAQALVHIAAEFLALLLLHRALRPARAVEGHLPLVRTSSLGVRCCLALQWLRQSVRSHRF